MMLPIGRPLRVLSLGAGVQSSTMALMAAAGEIEMPDVAIFADTKWEPKAVYDYLDWLIHTLPFEVITVSKGNIREAIRDRRNTSGGRFAAIPWHTVNPDGSHGMGRRQCSSEYKLAPIMHAVRELLGKTRRQRIAAGSATIMIGISSDEAQRMRPARQAYMRNVYPLCDLRMSRSDCIRWLERSGNPIPPKSACIGCPFHDDAYWRNLHDTGGPEWADAVEADGYLRLGNSRGMRAVEYMHRQRVPLSKVDFTVPEDLQLSLFGNECEGMCGT